MPFSLSSFTQIVDLGRNAAEFVDECTSLADELAEELHQQYIFHELLTSVHFKNNHTALKSGKSIFKRDIKTLQQLVLWRAKCPESVCLNLFCNFHVKIAISGVELCFFAWHSY